MKNFILLNLLIIIPFLGYAQSIKKYDPQELYEERGGLFDVDSLRTISIEFYNPDYHSILVDNWFDDNSDRLPARIELGNDIIQDSVGIRYKGNSTFYITNDFGVPKLPWNIDINEYVSGQKIMSYKKLKLANSMFDPTFVKEILAYSIYQKYLPAPEANFMRVEVQGDYLGLYINTETVDKVFLKKHFNEKKGAFFKCDPIQRYGIPGPSGRSDLKWLGSDSLLYYNHYEIKSDRGWKEFIHMIDVLNHHPEQIDSVLNVDRILWAFAVNQVISNFDTYNGVDQRNYYLYQTNDGLFQMIPWDVSESFINAMLGDLDDPNGYYSYNPYKGAKSWWYPLCEKLTGNPESKYGKIYTAHLRTVLEENLNETELLNSIDYLQAIAREAVNTDPNNIWSNLIYRANVNADFNAYGYSFAGIMKTVRKRKEYLEIHPELQKEAPVITDVIINKSNNSYYVNSIVSNADDVELMVCSNANNSKFRSFVMNDDGTNGDTTAGDGVFTAPVHLSTNTTDFKFYIRASNADAIQLSPQRAEYEFYVFSTLTGSEFIREDKAISLYPNPTKGPVFFKGELNGTVKYEVLSSMGKTLKNGELNSVGSRIDISAFTPGMYFIKIDDKAYKIFKSE